MRCCAIILGVIIIPTPTQLKCDWCTKVIKKDTLYVKHNSKKYFHSHCYELYKTNISDRKDLLDYIIELQGHKKLNPKLLSQIKDWQEKFGFKYKGIELTLRYFHEIKGNAYDDGIGIVPYVYEDAEKFYSTLYEITQLINNTDYNPQLETVYVNDPPKKNKKIKKLVNIEEITND